MNHNELSKGASTLRVKHHTIILTKQHLLETQEYHNYHGDGERGALCCEDEHTTDAHVLREHVTDKVQPHDGHLHPQHGQGHRSCNENKKIKFVYPINSLTCPVSFRIFGLQY